MRKLTLILLIIVYPGIVFSQTADTTKLNEMKKLAFCKEVDKVKDGIQRGTLRNITLIRQMMFRVS